jgi:glycosyltransferase involved in cell wall biosynthesis
MQQGVGSSLRLPKVSVCIGCFNQAQFIETAIRSVTAQAYSEFECVVVDDLSTDSSRERIEACLAEIGDERFRFLPRQQNGGQMATLMTGLDATDGPLIAFLDGDDAWHPNFLECHVGAHLNGAGIAAISSSDQLLIDATGAVLAGGHPTFRRNDPRLKGASDQILRIVGEGEATLIFVDRGVTSWLWSTTSGMMFRRDAIVAMRPPDPGRIRICADTYLALAAHMLGGTVRLERVLGSYRLHANNGWAKQRVLGEGSLLGNVSPEIAKGVRAAVAERWCAIAPDMEPVLSRRLMRKALVDFVGWAGAIDLLETNAAAGFLLKNWATPGRRWLFQIVRHLPRKLRPRHLRDERTGGRR